MRRGSNFNTGAKVVGKRKSFPWWSTNNVNESEIQKTKVLESSVIQGSGYKKGLCGQKEAAR